MTKKPKAVARADAARSFPTNTCAASRHAQVIAEALMQQPHRFPLEDPAHMGESILSTVASLYEARTEIDRLQSLLAQQKSSYEREIEIEKEAAAAQVLAMEQLRAFAMAMIGDWPDVGGLDGFDLQCLGEKHGLLSKEKRMEPCGENCRCREDALESEWKKGVDCYRLTALVRGDAAMAAAARENT